MATVAFLNPLFALQWTRQLVAKGNKVIGSCRNPAEAAELKKTGVAHVVKLDVTDPSSIEVVAINTLICCKLFDLPEPPNLDPNPGPNLDLNPDPNLDPLSFVLLPHKHPHECTALLTDTIQRWLDQKVIGLLCHAVTA